MRQIVLDTETTGLSPESGDRVIEIGCVEIVNRRLTGRTLHFYLNPERTNSIDALKVHGVTDAFLADKPLFGQVADELLQFVDGAELIIHNAAFDIGFLDAELRRLGRPVFSAPARRVIDSMALARDAFPGKSVSLDNLCKRFEVNRSAREKHGALLDAGLLAEVYIRMTRGQGSLVIDGNDGDDVALASGPIDFSSLDLVVIRADDDEQLAHAALLGEIAKASGGRVVWHVG